MPTVFIERYKFRFYASDVGEPPHMHVLDGDKVAKIWLEPVAVQNNRGYNSAELNYVVKLTRQHQRMLLDRWNDYFSR
jgi:hypothetical protein